MHQEQVRHHQEWQQRWLQEQQQQPPTTTESPSSTESRLSLVRAIVQKRQYILVSIERYFHQLSASGSAASAADGVTPALLHILTRQHALRQMVGTPTFEQQAGKYAHLNDTDLLRLASLLQDLLKQISPFLHDTNNHVDESPNETDSPTLRSAADAAGAHARHRTTTVLADTYATVLRLGA